MSSGLAHHRNIAASPIPNHAAIVNLRVLGHGNEGHGGGSHAAGEEHGGDDHHDDMPMPMPTAVPSTPAPSSAAPVVATGDPVQDALMEMCAAYPGMPSCALMVGGVVELVGTFASGASKPSKAS
ncbi:hypothetical protein HDU97_000586 [Phlyctochytrium planicorne]|nr:hypothetical protein HDU97_000586 [Phlyctochytrium planicorne]